LVKGARCWVTDAKERVAVIQFHSGEQLALSRILMEKVSNGMGFSRRQVPLKLIYAGTVHRSQGMTLNRAVIDFRRYFWEHGQLYIALSRVRHPDNLCILLPESEEEIAISDPVAVPLRISVDRQVGNIVSTISRDTIRGVDTALSMPATHPSTTELPVDEFIMTPADQTDQETNDRIEALPSPSHNLDVLWSDNDSHHEHGDPVDPLTEYDYSVPPDHIREGEVISHEISTDSSIDVDDPLQRNEAIDFERVQNISSGTVNLAHLCARIVVLISSILACAVEKPQACFVSSLYRVHVIMSTFLILYRISKCDIDQI
jgi:hypothetical protein